MTKVPGAVVRAAGTKTAVRAAGMETAQEAAAKAAVRNLNLNF